MNLFPVPDVGELSVSNHL